MRIRMLMDYQGDLLGNLHFWREGEIQEVAPAIGRALIAQSRAALVVHSEQLDFPTSAPALTPKATSKRKKK